jgi:hypothetical protein
MGTRGGSHPANQTGVEAEEKPTIRDAVAEAGDLNGRGCRKEPRNSRRTPQKNCGMSSTLEETQEITHQMNGSRNKLLAAAR